jgi:amino acid adenylation domain-containing protein
MSAGIGTEDRCIHQLFEAQVARSPSAIALIDGDLRVSYGELDQRADRLAKSLRASGVTVESAVGVCCDPSADMIVALLGILKAGGAYVPIDPGSPRSWRESILTDARVDVVLTAAAIADRLAEPSTARGLEPEVSGGNATHILYTSGSTGRPKGVVGLHRAAVNRIRWAEETYPYGAGEVACTHTRLGFVDSVAEIFGPLACGVPLVVVGRDARQDVELMIAELAAAQVTRISVVPSLLSTLFEVFPDLAKRLPLLRYCFVTGEPMPTPLAALFKRAMPGRKLVNLYGSTEVAGDATYFDFDQLPAGATHSPIGRPIRGVQAWIVDETLTEVRDGEVGEICISGPCLARGYLGLPELTRARFVVRPVAEGGVFFRTGDLGRRLASGDLECMGRSDRQVKIRGMRVDLGEIEAILGLFPGIRHAVAIAEEDGHARRTLVALYVADQEFEAGDLRAHFASRVPDQMIPSRFVAMEEFPRNANGKIDRSAFPVTLTDTERRVAAAWEAVFGSGPIDRGESFYDIGGHSLAAIRIAARLREDFAIALPIQAIFAHPTISALAAHLDGPGPGTPAQRARLVVSGAALPRVLPLTHYQFPFWFFSALTGGTAVVSDVFGFSKPIDLERLQQAYDETVAGFDALWMRFSRWSPLQTIHPRRASRFAVIDRRLSPDPNALQEEADANNTFPFDLTAPPHIRARLVRLPGGDDRLLVAMPHLVGDMAAMGLFLRALQTSYEGVLPARRATASLADLVHWERAVSSEEIEDEAAYWQTNGPAWTTMPARLFTNKLGGKSVRALSSREIPLDLVARLDVYCRERALTVPMAVIGAVYAAMVRTAETDAVTLLLMLDRRARDPTRDLFSNLTALIRCGVAKSGAGTLDELLARLGAQLATSYDHADHQMRRPTFFNDFWATAPRSVRALVAHVGAAISRRWKDVDPDLLAEYFFALVPSPAGAVGRAWKRLSRQAPETRDILIAVNILPEVYEASESLSILRRRDFPLLVRPGDLMINTDLLLDTTLQVQVMRSDRGLLVTNVYGGGMDPQGLDEISDRILEVLCAVVEGRGGAQVCP